MYVVRVVNQNGKMIESVESSLRACVALVWGLKCEWWIHTRGESGELVACQYQGIGPGIVPYSTKRYSHNRRAFKASLVKCLRSFEWTWTELALLHKHERETVDAAQFKGVTLL